MALGLGLEARGSEETSPARTEAGSLHALNYRSSGESSRVSDTVSMPQTGPQESRPLRCPTAWLFPVISRMSLVTVAQRSQAGPRQAQVWGLGAAELAEAAYPAASWVMKGCPTSFQTWRVPGDYGCDPGVDYLSSPASLSP